MMTSLLRPPPAAPRHRPSSSTARCCRASRCRGAPRWSWRGCVRSAWARSSPRRPFGLDPVRRVHDAGFVDFLANAWADWSGARPHPRRAAAGVAGARPAPRSRARATSTASSASTRWTPACRSPPAPGTPCSRSADVALTGAQRLVAGAPQRVRAVPPARPSRRRGDDGRLLLPEQRGDRRAVPARPRLRARRDPRRRLPPRQRHAEHLLRPARRAVRVAARRPAGRVSRSSSATPTSGAPAPAPASPLNYPLPLGTALGHLRAARSPPPAARSHALRARRAGRVARRRHLRARPDLAFRLTARRLPGRSARESPRSAARRCS